MNKGIKRWTGLLLSLVMVLGIFPFNILPLGFAPIKAEAVEVGDFKLDGSSGYGYSGNVLTISGGGTYYISMKSTGTTTTTDTIKVTAANDVTLVLNSVLIENSSKAPVEVNATGKVTIKLAGESKLTSGFRNYPAIQKTSTGNQLVITSAEGDGSTSGTLIARANGNYAAAIGGANGKNGNNITIAGGTIEATAANQGAGIGGGANGSGTNIAITGGKVTALSNGGDYGGAGIGGGSKGNGSDITISGGEVTARGYRGAGIGGGSNGGSGSNITISGGNVTAASWVNSIGFGNAVATGASGSRSDIYISPNEGSVIYAKYAENGGETTYTAMSDVTGAVGSVYFHSEEFVIAGDFAVAGESGGFSYSNHLLTISGDGEYKVRMLSPGTTTTADTIKITSPADAAVTFDSVLIENSSKVPVEVNAAGKVTIKLSGESNLTSGYRNYAALQKTSTGNQLVITSAEGDGSTSGKLIARANGNYAAAIGGGSKGAGNNITIAGGTVEATAANQGAGIGGGSNGSGTNIVITGGKVTAESGTMSAGIGGGHTGSGSNITISGGEVTVKANSSDAGGIGGGANGGTASDITISGGEVTITSKTRAIGGFTTSNVKVVPPDGSAIFVTYTQNGEENPYLAETDITGNLGVGVVDGIYFRSRTAVLPVDGSESVINAGGNSIIITGDGASGTNVYLDMNSDGIYDQGSDVLFASGDLANTDIKSRGSLITVLGGKTGTISGDVNNTVVNLMGAPKVSIDLSTVKGNAVNVTGALTSPDGGIVLTEVTAGTTAANVSDAAFMQIDSSNSVEKAFTAEGFVLAAYTSDNTVKVHGVDESYILSLAVQGDKNYNSGDTIVADIVVSESAVAIGSAQLTLEGNWFTLDSAVSSGNINVDKDTKSLSVTDLNASGGAVIATVTLRVNSNINTTPDAQIGFANTGNYVAPVGSVTNITPVVTGASVNLHNIKVTFLSGNTVFDGDETKTSTIAYAKYNVPGLYTDAGYNTAFTFPVLTAKTGYRLANGTTESIWASTANSYLNNDAIAQAVFTEDTVISAQAIKTYVVVINGADAAYGTISGYTSPVTVDENTKLSEVVKDITFTPAAGTAYAVTGWSIAGGGIVYNAELDSYLITGDITITPYIQAGTRSCTEVNAIKASVSGIAAGDVVTYGQDVTFTVTPDPDTKIYSVSYTVGGGQPEMLTGINGIYTIPGMKIVDDIRIEVIAKSYYPVTFKSGAGNTMSGITAYAYEGVEGLYASLEDLGGTRLAASYIINGLSADEGYRLAADSADEPLWTDGTNYYTSEQLVSAEYTANAEYTAISVRQYTVRFTLGENGSLIGSDIFMVDEGKTLTSLPTLQPDDNYSFRAWNIKGSDYTTDELKALEITEDTTVRAEFEPSKYNISFAQSDAGTFTVNSGVDENNRATYLTDVEFTFTPDDNYRVERVYYTVNGVRQDDIVTSGSAYTIPGSSIKGDIAVSVDTQETKTFIFTTGDSTKGSVSGVTSFILDTGSYLTTEQLDTVIVNANEGYKFEGWIMDDATSSQAAVVPTDIPADRDITFKAMFGYIDYNVNVVEDAVDIISGVDANGYAHMNTDIVFEVKEGNEVKYVGYSIGDGEVSELTADSQGRYTIPGSAIVGDVNIVVEFEDISYLIGDASNDGLITANDAAIVLQKVLNNAFTTACEEAYPNHYMRILDVTADSILTADDASAILQKALNNAFEFPVEKLM